MTEDTEGLPSKADETMHVVPDSLALDHLSKREFNPRLSAILESAPDFELEEGATGTVTWREWGVDSQQLQVEASGPALPEWADQIQGKSRWHTRRRPNADRPRNR